MPQDRLRICTFSRISSYSINDSIYLSLNCIIELYKKRLVNWPVTWKKVVHCTNPIEIVHQESLLYFVTSLITTCFLISHDCWKESQLYVLIKCLWIMSRNTHTLTHTQLTHTHVHVTCVYMVSRGGFN